MGVAAGMDQDIRVKYDLIASLAVQPVRGKADDRMLIPVHLLPAGENHFLSRKYFHQPCLISHAVIGHIEKLLSAGQKILQAFFLRDMYRAALIGLIQLIAGIHKA